MNTEVGGLKLSILEGQPRKLRVSMISTRNPNALDERGINARGREVRLERRVSVDWCVCRVSLNHFVPRVPRCRAISHQEELEPLLDHNVRAALIRDDQGHHELSGRLDPKMSINLGQDIRPGNPPVATQAHSRAP